MWLTIVLSFGFYIPVVLWADDRAPGRHADDSQNLRLCVDGAHRILGHEGRSPENQVKTALHLEEKGKFS